MLQLLSRFLTRPDRHQTCDQHRNESAGLRAELHASYDRELKHRNDIARLQAENTRLTQANCTLRINQKDHMIQELVTRALAERLHLANPPLTIPCRHHLAAGMTYRHTG